MEIESIRKTYPCDQFWESSENYIVGTSDHLEQERDEKQ